MRYLLLFLLLAVQSTVFGFTNVSQQENHAVKILTLEKSDLEARSGKPFMYQGQYYDKEIELAYNRFRYYNPNDGRYISIDPIGLMSGEYGFYNYVSDPNGYIDAFGLEGYYSGNVKKKASSMEVVKRDSAEWKKAVIEARKTNSSGLKKGQSKFNIRVETKADAHAFLREVNNGKGMDRRKNHTNSNADGANKYQKGYEVHEIKEDGNNDLVHLKYYTDGPTTGSHIYYGDGPTNRLE